MNKSINQRIKKIIISLLVFDFLLIVLLLIPKKKSVKFEKKTLLNPVALAEVKFISLNVNENDSPQKLLFEKNDLGWFCNYEITDSELYFPLDKKSLDSFLEKFAAAIEVVTKSKNIKSHYNFGIVNENNEPVFTITFYDKNSEPFTSINFGNVNYLSNSIMFSVSDEANVYETNDVFSSYLTLDLSFWGDKKTVPDFIFNQNYFSDSESNEYFLRRGKISLDKITSPSTYVVSKKFDNGNSMSLELYQNTDSSYLVKPYFFAGSNLDNNKKEIFMKINYTYSISQMTANELSGEGFYE